MMQQSQMRLLDSKGTKGQNARFVPSREAWNSKWCSRCNHKATDCPFRKQECFKCNQMGHTRCMCRAQRRVNNLNNDNKQESSQEEEGELFDILQLPEQAPTSIKTLLVAMSCGWKWT